jgi:hypothetical protein
LFVSKIGFIALSLHTSLYAETHYSHRLSGHFRIPARQTQSRRSSTCRASSGGLRFAHCSVCRTIAIPPPQCGGVGSLSVGSTYNRLLYLLPPNEYQSLLAIIPEIDEFHEVRAVTAALASGDVTGILPFPGKIVTTFCQIWSEQHPGRQPRIRWPKAPGRADAETAANLALKLSVIPSADVLEAIGRHTPGARMLIELCCQSATDRSKITSLTYLDEMENLFRGVPHEDTQRLLTRRFDELEDVGLEALALGAGGYPMAWDLCNYAN